MEEEKQHERRGGNEGVFMSSRARLASSADANS